MPATKSSTSLLPAFLTSTLGAPASAPGLMGDEAPGRALDVAAGVVVAAGVGVGLAGLEHVPGNVRTATLFVAVVDAEVASQAA